MTRERDERMWNLAYRLAMSGEHRNYQAIEWELQASGYPRARQLLYHERVREKLDGMCAEAQKGFVDGLSSPTIKGLVEFSVRPVPAKMAAASAKSGTTRHAYAPATWA